MPDSTGQQAGFAGCGAIAFGEGRPERAFTALGKFCHTLIVGWSCASFKLFINLNFMLYNYLRF